MCSVRFFLFADDFIHAILQYQSHLKHKLLVFHEAYLTDGHISVVTTATRFSRFVVNPRNPMACFSAVDSVDNKNSYDRNINNHYDTYMIKIYHYFLKLIKKLL